MFQQSHLVFSLHRLPPPVRVLDSRGVVHNVQSLNPDQVRVRRLYLRVRRLRVAVHFSILHGLQVIRRRLPVTLQRRRRECRCADHRQSPAVDRRLVSKKPAHQVLDVVEYLLRVGAQFSQLRVYPRRQSRSRVRVAVRLQQALLAVEKRNLLKVVRVVPLHLRRLLSPVGRPARTASAAAARRAFRVGRGRAPSSSLVALAIRALISIFRLAVDAGRRAGGGRRDDLDLAGIRHFVFNGSPLPSLVQFRSNRKRAHAAQRQVQWR